MSRPLRLEFPGSLWHVTVRGNERRDIFVDDTDRNRFLDLLGESVDRFKWIVPTYALMPNHTHAVIQLTTETLSRGMCWLNGNYAREFNRRHRRVGHLFQGRFKPFLIDKDAYFLEVLRYVVLNPVRACIVAKPDDYDWTSYRAIMGAAEAPPWLAVDDALVQFGPTREIARANYCQFVDAGIGLDRKPWDDLVGQIYLGGEQWLEKVRTQIALKPRADEHPQQQRSPGNLAMADIVAAVASALSTDEARVRYGPDKFARMVAAWVGCYEALLPNRVIAAGLRLRSSSRVSALVRRCDRELVQNVDLQADVDRCIATLRRKQPTADLAPS